MQHLPPLLRRLLLESKTVTPVQRAWCQRLVLKCLWRSLKAMLVSPWLVSAHLSFTSIKLNLFLVAGTSSKMPVVARQLFPRAMGATFPARMQAPPVASSSRVPPTQQPPAQVHFWFPLLPTVEPSILLSDSRREAWYVVTAGREVGIFSNWYVLRLILGSYSLEI